MMEKDSCKLIWPNQRKCRAKDEKELYSVNYEDTSDLRALSDVSSLTKSPARTISSNDAVELSLEVEIADSLKHLITSPDKTDSALLDVTIVRPTDLERIRGLDTNSVVYRNNEIRNLIASMERQKQQKKRLIEECRRKVASSTMNPIIETQEVPTSDASRHHLLPRRNEQVPVSQKRRVKRSDNTRHLRNNITVMSAPTKTSKHAKYKSNAIPNTGMCNWSTAQPCSNSDSITILKPLVGEIRQSLKNLEARIIQVGDNHEQSNARRRTKHYSTSSAESSVSEEPIDQKHVSPNHLQDAPDTVRNSPQVYATANTHDKLKTLLSCQNSERNNQGKEKPCLCQHCGMVGLLVESQKRPILPTPQQNQPEFGVPRGDNQVQIEESEQELHHVPRRQLSKSRHAVNIKPRHKDEHYWKISDLSSRLEALENRVAAQEQRAVPKDYFKRVINKILYKQNSPPHQVTRVNNLDRGFHARHTSTQYSLESFEGVITRKSKKESKVKHRDVQIQQNSRRSYCINPVIVQTDSERRSQSNESRETNAGLNKNAGNKAISAIGDFFTKHGPEKDDVSAESKKSSEKCVHKDKGNKMDSFWRWGEEIIKPGFDLKTKILGLLEEQFNNIKHTVTIDSKSSYRKSLSKHTLPKKSFRANAASAVNLVDAPKPFEDREVQQSVQSKGNEKYIFPASSSRTLKRVLDMMSEKIYNDHVKPTVEAIKQEQKSLNKENTTQIHNIKAAMDAAIGKINAKDTQVPKPTSNRHESSVAYSGKEWQQDFLEPLEVPFSIQRSDADYSTAKSTLKSARKSGIPVRVGNAVLTSSTVTNIRKFQGTRRSLIPRLKSPGRDRSDDRKPSIDRSSSAKEPEPTTKPHRKDKHEQPSRKKKLEDQCSATAISKSKRNPKHVKVTYRNPKVDTWHDESSVSVPVATSEETNKVMLTANSSRRSNKCEKLQASNAEEKRRISLNHSVTDKLAFLTNITKTEMGKVNLWSSIWNQAKNYCKSKQDTVVIQVPTKTDSKHSRIDITEVEFTIEDIQKLINSSELPASTDSLPLASNNSGHMDSFLLIRSRRILDEVHKRLGRNRLNNTCCP